MTPEKIGRYEIRSELGHGGMATVFLAFDPMFKREVALKVLPREFLHDPQFTVRFEREAQTIAALEHSAIVPVHDFGEQDGQPFLVMRYMPGGSLSDKLRDGPLPIEEVARIFRQIAGGLDNAHRKGVIHRDIKPGNILFDQAGEAVIADFGIAKITESSSRLTGTALIGTPNYISPEQALGEKELDGRSDLYSLGVMLYETLAGSVPFDSDTPIGLIYAHINDPPPDILAVNPDLPPGCVTILDRALQKNPEARYQSAQELAIALSDLAKDKRDAETAPHHKEVTPRSAPTVIEVGEIEAPIVVEPQTPPAPIVTEPQSAPAPAAIPPPPQRRRTGVWIAAAGVVLILCVLSLGVLAVFGGQRLGFGELLGTATPSAEDHYNRAVNLAMQKNYEQAIDEYDLALALDPDLAEAYLGRGDAYYELEEYDLAIQDFDQVIANAQTLTSEQLVSGYSIRGWTYFELTEYDLALDDFNRAIAQDPEHASAYNGRGRVYHFTNNYSQAVDDFSQALALEPDNAVSLTHRAVTHAALDNQDQAIDDTTQAIAIDPSYARAYTIRADAYLNKDDFNMAIADYSQALELGGLNEHNTVVSYYWRGYAFAEIGDDNRAFEDFSQAIAIDPQYATAYNDRGNVLYRREAYQNAISDYSQALAIDPQYAIAYRNRGLAYSYLDDNQKAITDYNQAIAIDPQYADAYNSRGYAFAELGDYNQAIEDYNQALAFEPDTALYLGNRSWSLSELGSYDQAIDDATQAIAIDASLAFAYANRAWAYLFKDDFNRAIADYSQALDLGLSDESAAQAYSSRGYAYAEIGDDNQAIADYNQALAINPQDAAAYLNRGNVHYRREAYQSAIADYSQAIAIDSQFSLA